MFVFCSVLVKLAKLVYIGQTVLVSVLPVVCSSKLACMEEMLFTCTLTARAIYYIRHAKQTISLWSSCNQDVYCMNTTYGCMFFESF
jgi:hypothetical protein